MKKILAIQVLVSIFGTLFAFYNVFWDFYNYNSNCGSYLPVTNTFTHPFFTACFYGAFAFLTTAFLSIVLYKKYSVKIQKFFVGLSAFGVAFAWGNMALEIKKYLEAGSTSYRGCSGAIVSNPLFTPCFGGAVLFVILLIISVITFKKTNKKDSLQVKST